MQMNRDEDIRKFLAKQREERVDELLNPLAKYSDDQLKRELKRRKRIKDSTELSGGHLW